MLGLQNIDVDFMKKHFFGERSWLIISKLTDFCTWMRLFKITWQGNNLR